MADPQASDAPASAYDMGHDEVRDQRATFAVIVDNEPGVLHRIVGLFAGRGYNIESLTVAETDHRAHTSRITIVTSGAPSVLDQIRAQLDKTVCVRSIQDVTRDPLGVERELALVRVEQADEAQEVAKGLGARSLSHGVFELTGESRAIDRFFQQMRPFGVAELSRTGVLSISGAAE
jgi:acetolactate synthase-1/3 small subunit